MLHISITLEAPRRQASPHGTCWTSTFLSFSFAEAVGRVLFFQQSQGFSSSDLHRLAGSQRTVHMMMTDMSKTRAAEVLWRTEV